jgi:hypothetical protein
VKLSPIPARSATPADTRFVARYVGLMIDSRLSIQSHWFLPRPTTEWTSFEFFSEQRMSFWWWCARNYHSSPPSPLRPRCRATAIFSNV